MSQVATRIFLIACLFFLAGCVSSPFAIKESPDRPMAFLMLGARSEYPVTPKHDGIFSVDGRDIPGRPVQSIYLTPGKHKIGYMCPGWIVVDGPMSLTDIFVATNRYQIDCEKSSSLQQLPNDT